jgi:hypothetical protein
MPSFRWGSAAKKKKESAAAVAAEVRAEMEKEAIEIAKQERVLLEAEEAAEAETTRIQDLATAEAEVAAEDRIVQGPGRKGWLAVKTVAKTLFGQKVRLALRP